MRQGKFTSSILILLVRKEFIACRGKPFLLIAIVLIMVSVANADMNSSVNRYSSDATKTSEPKYLSTTTPYSHLKVKPRQEEKRVLRICPQLAKGSGSAIRDVNDKSRISATHNGSAALSKYGSVIDITSDITTNTLWTADNVYHVLTLIDVNNALLVIEPGTMVVFATGIDAAIQIINGGAMISCGTPGNEIIYTSDAAYPNYEDYYCPIYITETASPATQVKYSIVEWAYAGVVVLDRKLENNISDNYFANCVYGIVEFGLDHTDITNNLFYGSSYGAVEIYMESMTGQASSESSIFIRNNTCDNSPQWDGISIYGTADADDAGFASLENNMVSNNSRYGLVLANGYVYADVRNTGYYNNYTNKNYEFDEDNPVVLAQNPYETGTGFMPICYIDQNCPLVNGGYEYIEETRLIGKTTATDGYPDSNIIDIGFHYPNWDFSNAGTTTLQADFDNDCTVDYNDLAMFAGYWLYDYDENYQRWWWDFDDSGVIDFNDLTVITDYWLIYFDFCSYAEFAGFWSQLIDYRFENTRYDLKEDGFVDLRDLAVLASEWQKTGDVINLSVELSQEPNLVSDVLLLTLVGVSDDITCYLFMDGQYLGTFFGEDMSIPTYEYRNGLHEIKVVGVSLDNNVLIAPNIDVVFNNRLHCLTGSETYKYNQAYQFAGFYEPTSGSTIDFTIRDLDENIIWTNSSSGNFNFVVPAGILQSPYNDLTIQEAGGVKSTDSDWKSWIKDITKEFDVVSDPGCANAKSLLVGVKKGFMGIGDWTYERREVWKEYLQACEKRGLDPTICLFFGQATRANIQTAFQIDGVEAIYIISDGNRRVGDPKKDPNCPWRTAFIAHDGPFFSYLKRNWAGPPGDYISLGRHENGYSVADSINYFNAKPHLHVFHDCCKNGPMCMPSYFYNGILMVGNPPDNIYDEDDYNRTRDMAWCYGINPDSSDRNYMSWRQEAFGGDFPRYNTFLMALWDALGDWDTYKAAFFDAAHACTGCYVPAYNFSHVGDLDDRFIP